MKVEVFTNKKRKLVAGFTEQGKGSNLPNPENWIHKDNLDLEENSPLIGANPKKILSDIKKDGYSIQEAKITTTEIIK